MKIWWEGLWVGGEVGIGNCNDYCEFSEELSAIQSEGNRHTSFDFITWLNWVLLVVVK